MRALTPRHTKFAKTLEARRRELSQQNKLLVQYDEARKTLETSISAALELNQAIEETRRALTREREAYARAKKALEESVLTHLDVQRRYLDGQAGILAHTLRRVFPAPYADQPITLRQLFNTNSSRRSKTSTSPHHGQTKHGRRRSLSLIRRALFGHSSEERIAAQERSTRTDGTVDDMKGKLTSLVHAQSIARDNLEMARAPLKLKEQRTETEKEMTEREDAAARLQAIRDEMTRNLRCPDEETAKKESESKAR